MESKYIVQLSWVLLAMIIVIVIAGRVFYLDTGQVSIIVTAFVFVGVIVRALAVLLKGSSAKKPE